MHNASLKSPRLKAVLDRLKIGPHTTKGLILLTGYCAINSIIAEIRANGIDVNCKCLSKGVYQYSLKGE